MPESENIDGACAPEIDPVVPSAEKDNGAAASKPGRNSVGVVVGAAGPFDPYLNKLMDLYVDWPCTCMWVAFTTILLIAVLSILTGSMNMTTDVEGAWEIYQREQTQAWNVFQEVQKTDPTHWRFQDGEERRLLQNEAYAPRDWQSLREAAHTVFGSAGRRLQDEEEEDLHTITFFYNADGTVFSPAILQDICNIKKTVKESPFCEYDGELDACVSHRGKGQFSVLDLFYGATSDRSIGDVTEWSCDLLSQDHVDAVVQELLAEVTANGPRSEMAKYLCSEFPSTGLNPLSRSILSVKAEDKMKLLEEHVGGLFDPPLAYGFSTSFFQGTTGENNRYAQYKSGDLRVRLYHTDGWGYEFDTKMGPDFIMALGAVFIVFAIIWLYTGSLFIASIGMFQIMVSLVLAALIYRKIFMVDFFDFIHVLIVYLVLGIGADDIFVLVDSFKHFARSAAETRAPGEKETKEELKATLKATYMRTASAVFNTSFTTAAAFASCAVSKVMPMRTCGYYAATCIVMNYLMVITLTPAVLIVYHNVFENCACFKCRQRKEEEKGIPGPGFVEKGLMKYYFPALKWQVGPIKPVSLFLVLAMIGTGIDGLVFSMRLTPPRSEEQWFPGNHMFTGLWDFIVTDYYSASYERYAELYFFWGLDHLDTEEFDEYHPDVYKGEVVYDADFDISSTEAQASILRTCEAMRTAECALPGCKNTGYSTLMLQTTGRTHVCFLEDVQHWLSTMGVEELATGPQFYADLWQFHWEANHTHYDTDMLNSDGYGPDIQWANSVTSLSQTWPRRNVITGVPIATADPDWAASIPARPLKMVSVGIRTNMPSNEPFATAVDVRDLIFEFRDGQNSDAGTPAGLRTMKFHGYGSFARIDLGLELIVGLFSGCAIAAPIACVVLFISTRNVVLTVYAVFAIACVVLCVLGFCKSAMDWDLGIGEAIAGIIILGYSVDYVVHMGHIYCGAAVHGIDDRVGRTEYAVRNMGSTIFAGAVTTAASACIMFACFNTFFTKMAVLICMTIFFSFLYSFCFLVPMLVIAGPEGEFGNTTAMWRRCRECGHR